MNKFCDFHSFHADAYQKIQELEKVYDNLFDSQANGLIKSYINQFLAIKYNKSST